MANLKLQIKGKLSLTINPVIHSFIEFLPLGRQEFIETLNGEIDSNPMLNAEITSNKVQDNKPEQNILKSKFDRCDSGIMSRYEEDNFFRRSSEKMTKQTAIELFGTATKSLTEHLMEQAEVTFNPKELEVAQYIIFSLTPNGYLRIEVETIAASLNTTPEKIEKIRSTIQTFSPLGVASKDLQECLLNQITDENPELKMLINTHLNDLGSSNYDLIMKKMGIGKDELVDLIKSLKHLNPKPGSQFTSDTTEYANIDLMLIKEGEEYTVQYVEEGIPKLTLSKYYDQMYEKAKTKKTRSYLKEKSRNANLFIEGIELRKSMILQIARYLVKVQKDFLSFGEKWKKPLTMREVAEELKISESSVSRTVNGKFMASEKGILKLKTFFAHGFKSEFGSKHSVHTIVDKIKNIIDNEPKEKPFSDQIVSDKLKELGIKISRRTIRNYRDELNIPSSSQRKKKYRINI